LDISVEKTKTEMELVFEANDGPNNKMVIFRKLHEESGAYLYRMKGVLPFPISSFIGTQGNLQVFLCIY